MKFIKYILRRPFKIAYYLFVNGFACAVSILAMIEKSDLGIWANCLIIFLINIFLFVACLQPYKEWIKGGKND